MEYLAGVEGPSKGSRRFNRIKENVLTLCRYRLFFAACIIEWTLVSLDEPFSVMSRKRRVKVSINPRRGSDLFQKNLSVSRISGY